MTAYRTDLSVLLDPKAAVCVEAKLLSDGSWTMTQTIGLLQDVVSSNHLFRVNFHNFTLDQAYELRRLLDCVIGQLVRHEAIGQLAAGDKEAAAAAQWAHAKASDIDDADFEVVTNPAGMSAAALDAGATEELVPRKPKASRHPLAGDGEG